jgi:hypothetical protein
MTQQLQQLAAKTASHTCRSHVPPWHSSFYRFEQLRRLISAQTAAQWCTLPILLLILCSAAAAPAVATADRCAPSDGMNYICGLTASEDLVRVPRSSWLIASGMNVGAPAHLYLVDSQRKYAVVAFPTDSTDRSQPFHSTMGCRGPPDPARMSLDGLALRPGVAGRHTLYAANHGDRMAIELFAVDARGAQPRLRWIDCATLPGNTLPNAVATLPQGGLLVISFYDPTDPQSWSRMARGQMTGRILRWHPGKGFAPLPDGATSGGNGLETSADGHLVYASSWSARKLVVLSLLDGSRRQIPLDFMPDNIHRLPDGSLLVGGQRTTVDAIHACTGPQCPQPWVVARVKPDDGAVTVLLEGRGNPAVNYACGAVAVADTLFVTVRGDQRIIYRRLPAASFGSSLP